MIGKLSSGTKSTLRSSVTSQQVGNVNRLSSYQSSVGCEFVSLSSIAIFLISAPPSSLSEALSLSPTINSLLLSDDYHSLKNDHVEKIATGK